MTDKSTISFAVEPLSVTRGRGVDRQVFRHTGLLFGGLLVSTTLFFAIFAPWLTHYDPYSSDLANRFIPPFWQDGSNPSHLLGTDQLGRDYYTRLIYGARISLLVGLVTVVIAGTIGTVLGVMAGYFRGRAEQVILFVITTRLALPVILVALAVVNVSGSSLVTVCAVLGLLLWDRFAVVARSSTQQIRSLDYVMAAKASGLSDFRIMVATILPNIINPLIVVATLEIAHAIVLEASLSFLGIGVPPPLPSWGLMVADGKEQMFFVPWIITIPGMALFFLVLGINLLGDGLRDLISPKKRS